MENEQEKKIEIYKTQLFRYQKAINLVSSQTLHDFDGIHLTPCLKFCNFISKFSGEMQPESSTPFFDLGSGNGLPGVLYSITNKEETVHLVDSDKRKALFLKEIVLQCELKAKVLCERIEELPPNLERGMSRGLGNLDKLLKTLAPLFIEKGMFFYFTGEGKIAPTSHWRLVHQERYFSEVQKTRWKFYAFQKQ